ncbi:DUF1292 domain-containing protein [Weissella paramesenteroides]|uniref:DUF1292 domain-containing protein n=1 Tax=Weissella paramesenteroides TaxID=1249 RepID=UPI003F748109
MDNAEIFILTDSDGQEHEFQELFSFDSEDFQRSYIILGPVEEAEAEEIGVLPFIYDKDAEEGMLQPIETDEEFAMVEEVMNTIFNDPKLR